MRHATRWSGSINHGRRGVALFGSGIWGILVIVGPLLLLGAIAWAALNNRQSRRGEQRTEDATRALYREQDRADKSGESSQDR